MKPFFSIIVPCCDVEPYLRDCLESVLRDPFTGWECILGVETSKDRTEEIVREYVAKDPRFKMFTGPRSGSCSASREHLVSNGLKCLYGMKRQDSEFAPRALYLAKRVIPIHVPYYLYRIRAGSISTLAKKTDYFLKDYAAILKSLLAFHAKVSREPGFDRRLSAFWARHWLNWICYYWFAPRAIRGSTRTYRVEMLQRIFVDGFGDFNALVRAASRPRRVAAHFVRLFVRHPSLAWLSDAFFRFAYNPLSALREN